MKEGKKREKTDAKGLGVLEAISTRSITHTQQNATQNAMTSQIVFTSITSSHNTTSTIIPFRTLQI